MPRELTARSDDQVTWSSAFYTRQIDDPLGFVRTFGRVLERVGSAAEPAEGFELPESPPSTPPSNCASGKIAVLGIDADNVSTVSYQLSDSEHHAEIVGCSNASAAAAARYAVSAGSRVVTLDVELPGEHRSRIDASVRDADGSMAVRQTWHGLHFTVREESPIDGRSVAVCIGPLNSYVVVHALPAEKPSQFSLDDALALWQHFELDRVPLLSRIAIVQTADPRCPDVKFFTVGAREHPSAPLTGLAVLALAARRLDWLPMRHATRVRTAHGTVRMPRARLLDDGSAELRFPEVIVDFADQGGARDAARA